MDRETLRKIGEGLYGAPWQSPLARDLNVSLRTMQRWAAGGSAIPDRIQDDLAPLIRERIATLKALLRKTPGCW